MSPSAPVDTRTDTRREPQAVTIAIVAVLAWVLLSLPLGIFVGKCIALGSDK